jgi:hypothetical protein
LTAIGNIKMITISDIADRKTKIAMRNKLIVLFSLLLGEPA